jgi:alpha-D-glucose phosphate-specific phosphoglucomutase
VLICIHKEPVLGDAERRYKSFRGNMAMKVSPLAGKPAEPSTLVNVPRLVTAYYTEVPDPSAPEQRVSFGPSGHRGSAFRKAFNEWHILAISQAICLYRGQQKIDGPLFLGMDTHALSVPALAGALEVLAANRVDVMTAEKDEYTPTPVVSHAILTYNRGRKTRLADGIVITPSHNSPHDGGFKYNPPNGGTRRHGLDRGEGERISREWPARRLVWLWRGRECGGIFRPSGWQGLDDG